MPLPPTAETTWRSALAVRPLRQGAITDFEVTQEMIRLLLKRVGVNRFNRPRVVICVPSAITAVEKRAVTEAARKAGATEAQLIEQPMAAAIGAGLRINEPMANMVVDIGGGTAETALISLGGIVALQAVRVGSFDIDASIITHIRREYGIAIGEQTAEEIKILIGSAYPTPDEARAEVRGRELMSGLPKTVVLSAAEVRAAIAEPVNTMVDSVLSCVAEAPPELYPEPASRFEFKPWTRETGVGGGIGAFFAYLKANWRFFLPLYLGNSLVTLAIFGMMTWMPAIMIRGHGYDPAGAGYLFGLVGVACGIGGSILWPRVVMMLTARGYRDPVILAIAVSSLIAWPFVAVAPSLTNAALLLVGMGIGIVCNATIGTLMPFAIQTYGPPRFRSRLMSLVMLSQSLIGYALGPLTVALLAKNWPDDGMALGYGLSIVGLIFAPAGWACYTLARRALARRELGL